MLIDGKFGTDHLEVLRGLGTDPRTLYGAKEEFDLESALLEFYTQIEGTTRKTMTVEDQYRLACSLLEDPFPERMCAFITGYPTDERAKMLGTHILKAAWKNSPSGLPRRRPLWITLYNNFLNYDKLKEKKPSALFISNVTDQCTSSKLERLRDLLEIFSDIPRVVMIGSATDPITFASTRLRYAITHPIAIGGKTMAVSIMDGL